MLDLVHTALNTYGHTIYRIFSVGKPYAHTLFPQRRHLSIVSCIYHDDLAFYTSVLERHYHTSLTGVICGPETFASVRTHIASIYILPIPFHCISSFDTVLSALRGRHL